MNTSDEALVLQIVKYYFDFWEREEVAGSEIPEDITDESTTGADGSIQLQLEREWLRKLLIFVKDLKKFGTISWMELVGGGA